MKSFMEWWYSERVGRAEEGTSQDMCPTNGDAVILHVIMIGVGLLMAIAMIIESKGQH